MAQDGTKRIGDLWEEIVSLPKTRLIGAAPYRFLRASRYVLKCGIRKFFASVDHAIVTRVR
jgi:hypothetical protein